MGRSARGGSFSVGRVGGVVDAGSGVGSGRSVCSSSLVSLQASKASRGSALENRRKKRDIRRAAYTAWHNLARGKRRVFTGFCGVASWHGPCCYGEVMPSPSVSYKTLRVLRPSLVATSFAAAAFLAAAPASADECMNDSDCGFGFACETVVTSSITTGTGGAGYCGTAGTGTAGTSGTSGTTGSGFGGASTGGRPRAARRAPLPRARVAWRRDPGRFAATATAKRRRSRPRRVPPTACSRRSAPARFARTTCSVPPATRARRRVASARVAVRTPRSAATASARRPRTRSTCPFDCDPNYRRCAPGNRGCQSDLDCVAGYVCVYSGGEARAGRAGASGSAGSTSTGGLPGYGGATGGAAGSLGKGGVAGSVPVAGTSGSASGGFGVGGRGGTGGSGGAAPIGGSAGMMGGALGSTADGVCIPGGAGGTDGRNGGRRGRLLRRSRRHGGRHRGHRRSERRRRAETNGAEDGDAIVTHGGCSMANGSASSSFAALLLGAAALLRFGRRRASRNAALERGGVGAESAFAGARTRVESPRGRRLFRACQP